MVNRVNAPNISQARRDANSTKINQLGALQQMQQSAEEAPRRNRLLDLQADTAQQNMRQSAAEAPARQRLLGAQAAGAEAGNRDAEFAAFVKSAPLMIESIKQIRSVPEGPQRQQMATELAAKLEATGVNMEGFDPTDPNETSERELIQLQERMQSVVREVSGRGSSETRTKEQKNFEFIQELEGRVAAGELDPKALAAVKNEMGLLTPEEQAQKQAGIAGASESAKQQEQRVSALKSELSENSRRASSSSATIREALAASSDATQGIPGAVKVQIGRLFPGVDTADEAALDGALKTLAVQQLQNFKGPTTDFEFTQVQNITGKLSDGRSANEARLAALDRSMWFMDQELEMFNKFVDQGGNPDKWRGWASMKGETVKFSGGEITMQDLRDTAAANHITIEETLRRLNQ